MGWVTERREILRVWVGVERVQGCVGGCLRTVSEPEGSHITGERMKERGREGRVEGARGCRKPRWACSSVPVPALFRSEQG